VAAPDESPAEASPYATWTDLLRPSIHEVVDELERRVDEVAEATSAAVAAELPEFRAGRSDTLMAEVPGLVRVNYLLLLKVLREERMPIPEEFAFLASQVSTRVQQGLSMGGMLRGYRIGHRVAWDTALELCETKDQSGELVQALSRPTMAFIDALSAAVSEAYLQVTRISEAERDAEAQEFVESALAGVTPAGSSFAEASIGILDSDPGFLVVRADLAGRQDRPATSLRRLAATMGQLGSGGGRPAVAVPRRSGVIGFFAIGEQGAGLVCSHLLEAQPLIEREAGGRALIGVGLPCADIADTGRGLASAESALRMATLERRFVALPTVPVVEFLTGQVDPTLRQVVDARMAHFVEADDRSGGSLSETIRAYVQANQNSRVAAQLLHCHYNTVNYRVRKIKGLTGLDLNDVADLMELRACLQIMERGAGS